MTKMSMFAFVEWVDLGSYGIKIDDEILYAESFMTFKGKIYKYTKDGTNFYRVTRNQLLEVYNEFIKPTFVSFPCPQKISFFYSLDY